MTQPKPNEDPMHKPQENFWNIYRRTPRATTIWRWEPGHLRGFGPIPVFHGDFSQTLILYIGPHKTAVPESSHENWRQGGISVLWINSSLWVENRSEGAQWVILHHASTKNVVGILGRRRRLNAVEVRYDTETAGQPCDAKVRRVQKREKTRNAGVGRVGTPEKASRLKGAVYAKMDGCPQGKDERRNNGCGGWNNTALTGGWLRTREATGRSVGRSNSRRGVDPSAGVHAARPRPRRYLYSRTLYIHASTWMLEGAGREGAGKVVSVVVIDSGSCACRWGRKDSEDHSWAPVVRRRVGGVSTHHSACRVKEET
ncbi:hypothetical protein C8R44DRAFT_734893 [Mycena epipterygia]|nr:hypothetical protein C8R44DRAFT_734893 [Mycena epipterygia]